MFGENAYRFESDQYTACRTEGQEETQLPGRAQSTDRSEPVRSTQGIEIWGHRFLLSDIILAGQLYQCPRVNVYRARIGQRL